MDLSKLLDEVSPDAPCGDNLEYDAAFGQLEQSARGTPEQQIGNVVTAAEEPNWRDVQKQALGLLGRTKDLRIAVYLTQALVFTEGMPGLRDGLALVRGLVERYWATVHPQLDPDDEHDPTQRINVMMSLCDPSTVLKGVRQAPLAASRALGRFSLRDIHLATGRLPLPAGSDQAAPKIETIHAAFADSDLDHIRAVATAAQAARDDLSAIEACVAGQVDPGVGPDFSVLGALLKETQQVLSEQLARREAEGPAAQAEAIIAAPEPGRSAIAPPGGETVSCEEVAHLLDEACGYFEQHEPSSPVPLLLRRAKRLVARSFMDIIRDLTPDAVSATETISGAQSAEPVPDQSVSDLIATLSAIDQIAVKHLQRSDTSMQRGVTTAFAPAAGADGSKSEGSDSADVIADLAEIQRIVRESLTRCGVAAGEDIVGTRTDARQPQRVEAALREISGPALASREDVIQALDMVCEYFKRNEPSSPVSFLVRRAKRLVSKDFLEIIRDLAPGAVPQAELIGGDLKEE